MEYSVQQEITRLTNDNLVRARAAAAGATADLQVPLTCVTCADRI